MVTSKKAVQVFATVMVVFMCISICASTAFAAGKHTQNQVEYSESEADKVVSLDHDEMIDALVEEGYTEETAEALSEEDLEYVYSGIESGDLVDVYTCSMEVDNLAEIEAFYSYSEEELIAMGIDEEAIQETEEQLEEMYNMNNSQLEQEYGLDEVDAKLFRKAVENGKAANVEERSYGKELENPVSASGSITSSEMSYTQSVTSNSSTLPNYTVKLSYTWKSVYALAVYNDKIVAAWGGNLNSKSYSTTAKYYNWSTVGGSFGSTKVKTKSMTVDVTPNAGVEFTFPQSYGTCSNGNAAKTKTGSASFTLYQTKKQGYDTTLISNYCHRVISVKSASISISASGPSVSLSIGGAWDKTSQKKTTIAY